jgi:hypothetical protein
VLSRCCNHFRPDAGCSAEVSKRNDCAYLNRGDLLHDLGELTRQLGTALQRGEPPVTRSVCLMALGFRQRRLADRLDDAQVQAIVSAFEAGTPRWQLAEQNKISIRSVGR